MRSPRPPKACYALLWLGPSYGALPLFNITNDTAKDSVGRFSSVDVTYAHPFIDGNQAPGDQVSITQRPPLTAEEKANRAQPGGSDPGQTVTVGGRQGRLYNDGPQAYRLELDIDDTFVTVAGTSKEQVLQAAALLQRLNPSLLQ